MKKNINKVNQISKISEIRRINALYITENKFSLTAVFSLGNQSLATKVSPCLQFWKKMIRQSRDTQATGVLGWISHKIVFHVEEVIATA